MLDDKFYFGSFDGARGLGSSVLSAFLPTVLLGSSFVGHF